VKLLLLGMKSRLIELLLFRYFAHLIVVLSILILMGGYFVFIKPTSDLLKPGGPLDVKGYENILAQEKIYLQKVENLKQQYNNLDQAKLNKLSYLVSEKFDEPSLLYLFENINEKQGVVPEVFNYSSANGATHIKISFNNKDYSAFKDYLTILEKSVRLIDVNAIQMSVMEGTYSVDLTTYYLAD